MTPPSHEDAGGFGELPLDRPDTRPSLGRLIQAAIDRHSDHCSLQSEQIPERLRNLELRTATLIGMMIGTGTLGGTIGAALIKLLP